MKYYYLIIGLLPLFTSCDSSPAEASSNEAKFTVSNTLDAPRIDALFVLDAATLQTKFSELDLTKVKFTSGENAVPFQANDNNGDGVAETYALLLDFAANEEKTVQLVELGEGEKMPTFPKRTQAEISHKVNGHWEGREYIDGEFKNIDHLNVPPEHTDHSWFIRYEGPGWESDLVGYRFYLDWRNATDIFGKKTPKMVLQDVGLDGFDSYHEPSDWGMDVLKVGSSLGIGALGTWQEDKALRVETTDSLSCTIVENGVVESKIITNYFGWQVGDVKTDVTSELSIHAGSRLTRHDVILSNELANLCTGIVKHPEGKVIQGNHGGWAYLATWGAQSLAEDHLGMAVVYRIADAQQTTQDEHSNVVVLTPKDLRLTYYFMAAWEQEPNAIKTEEAFVKYLDGVVTELSSPLDVRL